MFQLYSDPPLGVHRRLPLTNLVHTFNNLGADGVISASFWPCPFYIGVLLVVCALWCYRASVRYQSVTCEFTALVLAAGTKGVSGMVE